jgi:hypothetical protein
VTISRKGWYGSMLRKPGWLVELLELVERGEQSAELGCTCEECKPLIHTLCGMR